MAVISAINTNVKLC